MPVNSQRSLHRDLSLKTVLIVPFVLQVISVVGIVGYLSFLNGQKAVNNIANQLRQELATRIKSELTAYLQTPEKFNNLTKISRENLPEVPESMIHGCVLGIKKRWRLANKLGEKYI